EFTMGVITKIDGKKCFFTADNFFHQDMFSGSGGWMGLNRSWPLPYAASAQKVLDAAPDWVLAEHGGPFEFSAEDFKRRVKWGEGGGGGAATRGSGAAESVPRNDTSSQIPVRGSDVPRCPARRFHLRQRRLRPRASGGGGATPHAPPRRLARHPPGGGRQCDG